MNEKVTDGARGMFEKATGYLGPPLILAWKCKDIISTDVIVLDVARKCRRSFQTRLSLYDTQGANGTHRYWLAQRQCNAWGGLDIGWGF